MKIFAISDLHLSSACEKPMNIFGTVWDAHWEIIRKDWTEKVGKDDLVLMAGDTSWAMSLTDALPDLKAISALPGKKVLIRGNHDYWWASRKKLRESVPQSIVCLQNDAVRIGNCVICGSRGWTVPEPFTKQTEEDKHIYEHELLRFRLSLEEGKKLLQEGDKLYVLSHYPPFHSRFDDSDFTKLFEEYGVTAVVYGHLHGSASRITPQVDKSGILYHLTSCDLMSMKLKLLSE